MNAGVTEMSLREGTIIKKNCHNFDFPNIIAIGHNLIRSTSQF